MRALIISIVSLAICIGIWCFFYQYSNNQLHSLISSCENQVLNAIEKEDWQEANSEFVSQYNSWHQYQKIALYMLDTDTLNDIDEAYAKTLMYIKAEDVSNSSGELLALKESLIALHHGESISFNNIF